MAAALGVVPPDRGSSLVGNERSGLVLEPLGVVPPDRGSSLVGLAQEEECRVEGAGVAPKGGGGGNFFFIEEDPQSQLSFDMREQSTLNLERIEDEASWPRGTMLEPGTHSRPSSTRLVIQNSKVSSHIGFKPLGLVHVVLCCPSNYVCTYASEEPSPYLGIRLWAAQTFTMSFL
ncbi:hypothetical protein L7F22_047747 [Adiantum nelumboides]|nr:hypothetical protein [Adiantum nelumboides]